MSESNSTVCSTDVITVVFLGAIENVARKRAESLAAFGGKAGVVSRCSSFDIAQKILQHGTIKLIADTYQALHPNWRIHEDLVAMDVFAFNSD
jgi:hypothetical protein